MIEEVKKILNGHLKPQADYCIEEFAQQICQLFPKTPDRTKLRERIARWLFYFSIDEGRKGADWEKDKAHYLWKTDQILAFIPDNPDGYEPKPDEGRLLTPEKIADIALHCYTDNKLSCVEGAIREGAQAQRDLTASIKDAECQARVERIFREIEGVYGETFGAKQKFIGVIPSEDWQALKKKEGVKDG